MPKLFQDGRWVIRKAVNTDYHYIQHKHYVGGEGFAHGSWEFTRVDVTGKCHVCAKMAPKKLLGFKRLIEWRR